MSSDQEIEQEIVAKGLTKPRVTAADVEREIFSEHYFTAAEGALGASPEGGVFLQPPDLKLLTFCVLVMRNGFTVVGQSACAHPENFDAEVGRKLARRNAVSDAWRLLGFRLRDQLAAQ